MLEALKDAIRKYYKYIETSWTQPILTSNGTLGGDSFAVSGTNITGGAVYRLFDGDTSSYCQSNTGGGDLIFYNPTPLKITNINILGWTDDNWWVKNCYLYGSDDNSTWVSITNHPSSFISLNWNIPNSNYYKYYKLSWSRDGNYGLLWRKVTLTATQRQTVEATEDDYDFFKDVSSMFCKLDNGKYYMFGTKE